MKPVPRLSLLHRLAALAGIAVVLVLAVLAACPELHHHVHETEAGHQCAITHFATGTVVPAMDIALVLPPAFERHVRIAPPQKVFVAAARYLRQPERGPPGSLVR